MIFNYFFISHSSHFTPIAKAKSYKGEQLLEMLLAIIRDWWSPGKSTSSCYQVSKCTRNGKDRRWCPTLVLSTTVLMGKDKDGFFPPSLITKMLFLDKLSMEEFFLKNQKSCLLLHVTHCAQIFGSRFAQELDFPFARAWGSHSSRSYKIVIKHLCLTLIDG